MALHFLPACPISVHCDRSGADLGAIGPDVGIVPITEESPFDKYLAIFVMELVLHRS
jgi:hypothetical protein